MPLTLLDPAYRMAEVAYGVYGKRDEDKAVLKEERDWQLENTEEGEDVQAVRGSGQPEKASGPAVKGRKALLTQETETGWERPFHLPTYTQMELKFSEEEKDSVCLIHWKGATDQADTALTQSHGFRQVTKRNTLSIVWWAIEWVI
ncbi:hypothetical protein NDU88_006508 [Pleurodeles waltl]|uniref:Uncharacterized protein n=1 Tax=Pleurodeles waltl TaxID=8319 RepID=A0AAV7N487_PLEWA|nr:hypothetical protein NDU88_006508 [Pleurodeles waltl]